MTPLRAVPTGIPLERDKLAAWLRSVCAPTRQAGFRAHCFSFWHSTLQGKEPLGTEPINPKLDDDGRETVIQHVVTTIEEAANNTADMVSGKQLFLVHAHSSVNGDTPAFSTYRFIVQSSNPQNDWQTTEPPTIMGVTGGQQRTIDKLISASQSDKDRLVDLNEKLMSHVEKLSEQNFAFVQQREQLLDARAERDLRVYNSKLESEMWNDIWGTLSKFGIAIGSDFAEKKWGVKVMGEEPGLDIVKSLRPKQLVAFLSNLDPEQQEKFRPMLKRVLDTLSEEEKTKLMQAYAEEKQKALAAEASKKKEPDK